MLRDQAEFVRAPIGNGRATNEIVTNCRFYRDFIDRMEMQPTAVGRALVRMTTEIRSA